MTGFGPCSRARAACPGIWGIKSCHCTDRCSLEKGSLFASHVQKISGAGQIKYLIVSQPLLNMLCPNALFETKRMQVPSSLGNASSSKCERRALWPAWMVLCVAGMRFGLHAWRCLCLANLTRMSCVRVVSLGEVDGRSLKRTIHVI